MDTYLLHRISAQAIDPDAFRPYGQVITAATDGAPYGANDAQLDLQHGIPRFYIMRLHHRGRKFHTITRHNHCTQCLGALEGKDWLLGVAAPGASAAPNWGDIQVFRIPGHCFVKLDVGTWHAGPYFDHDWVDFYNLELSDTNVVDHHICNLLEQYGVEVEII